jgi:micrococcal nuclease
MRRAIAAALGAAVVALGAGGCGAVGAADGLLSANREARPREAVVDHDVDGDTLSVELAARRRYVRLVGIDTPESVRPGTPVECGAERASRSLARMAPPGTRLRLVSDPTQDGVDRYGRLLRYAELAGSGTDLGAAQVRRGWASVYVYHASGPAERVPAYRREEAGARAGDRGVFGRCGGAFHRPAEARR